LGGSACLKLALSHPQVKCVLTNDAWLSPLSDFVDDPSLKRLFERQELVVLNRSEDLLHNEGILNSEQSTMELIELKRGSVRLRHNVFRHCSFRSQLD